MNFTVNMEMWEQTSTIDGIGVRVCCCLERMVDVNICICNCCEGLSPTVCQPWKQWGDDVGEDGVCEAVVSRMISGVINDAPFGMES